MLPTSNSSSDYLWTVHLLITMKTSFSNTLFILSILVLLGSCTIEKRLYRSGFNVQWKGFNHQVKSQESVAEEFSIDAERQNNRVTTNWNEHQSSETVIQSEENQERTSFHPSNEGTIFSKNNAKNYPLVEKSTERFKSIPHQHPAQLNFKEMFQQKKHVSKQRSNDGIDLLYSIGWLLLLGLIATLVIIGIFIGFALIIKLALFLLFILLFVWLIYVFSLALL